MLLIEPVATAFDRLLTNFAGRSDVRLEQCALGAQAGEAKLQVASTDLHSSLLKPGGSHLEIWPGMTWLEQTVPVRTLDSLGTEPYDAMILDVQGYELEALKGATETLSRLSWIRCEVSTVEMYAGQPLLEEIDGFLTSRGFERTALNPGIHEDAIYERTDRPRI